MLFSHFLRIESSINRSGCAVGILPTGYLRVTFRDQPCALICARPEKIGKSPKWGRGRQSRRDTVRHVSTTNNRSANLFWVPKHKTDTQPPQGTDVGSDDRHSILDEEEWF